MKSANDIIVLKRFDSSTAKRVSSSLYSYHIAFKRERNDDEISKSVKWFAADGFWSCARVQYTSIIIDACTINVYAPRSGIRKSHARAAAAAAATAAAATAVTTAVRLPIHYQGPCGQLKKNYPPRVPVVRTCNRYEIANRNETFRKRKL